MADKEPAVVFSGKPNTGFYEQDNSVKFAHEGKDVGKMSERELRSLVMALSSNIAVSAGLKCPNCDDIGYTVEAVQARSPFSDHGDDFECQQVQCEFCYTVQDSIFNRKMEANPPINQDGT